MYLITNETIIIGYVETIFTCKFVSSEKGLHTKRMKLHWKVTYLDQSIFKKVHFIVKKKHKWLMYKIYNYINPLISDRKYFRNWCSNNKSLIQPINWSMIETVNNFLMNWIWFAIFVEITHVDNM